MTLLEEYGQLQLERETHLARLQDTNRRMEEVKKKLIETKAKTNKANVPAPGQE